MFKVILSENRLVRLEKRRFSDLNLQERPHLQEWLVQTPEALGEELLVIQKEFDGFADTRERLDLLALDKKAGWWSSRTSSTIPAATSCGRHLSTWPIAPA